MLITFNRISDTSIVTLDSNQIGNILFCLGQVADNPQCAANNRKDAQDLYVEIKEALSNANIL